MNYKQKLGYTVLGAVIMLIGMSVNSILSPPLNAQRNGVFDEIHCNRITVFDEYDRPAIILSPIGKHGNGIILADKAGKNAATLHTKEGTTALTIYNPTGPKVISLAATEVGSGLTFYDDKGQYAIVLNVLNEFGQVVAVHDEKGEEAISLSSINEIANDISISDNEGKPAIHLASTESINRIKIFEKADNKGWEAP